VGGTVNFQVGAGGVPLFFQWQWNGSNLPNATNITLTLSAVTTDLAGAYTVVITNSLGAVTSQVAMLTVQTVPAAILTQPVNRSVSLGAIARFSVVATGAPPPILQWFHDGTSITDATNATLVIPNVASNHLGGYYVIASNAYGSATSSVAMLTIQAAGSDDFKITALLATGSRVVDHDAITGDDNGGIAASATRIFYTGDNSSGRFSLDDLSGGSALGVKRSAWVSDLATETIYSLANGSTPLTSSGTATALLEHNGDTGALTGNSIPLSTPIVMAYDSGIFAGYRRIVVHNGSRVYSISLPSGEVTDLGAMSKPSHQNSENWAYWGVAEFFEGNVHLAYAKNPNIMRVRVPDGTPAVLAAFSNLSDMACFTVSLARNRWYFHHENASQFGGTIETIGYADATFEYNVTPVEPPRLLIGFGGGAPQIGWPSAPGFVLESSTNLASGSWQAITGPFATNNNQVIFTSPMTNNSEYYRLRQIP
jgi:hypothetical protein